MGTPSPAPYSNTDAAEQDAVNTFKSLIDTRFVKDEIRTRDKIPNIDGTIELVHENGVPHAKFDVQIRKLPPQSMSYSCPTTLVGYSKISTLPVLLVCADPERKVAFWRQIYPTMPEYKEGQQSFTIRFDELADSIDHRGIYLQKWASIAADYQERIAKYPELKDEAGYWLPFDRTSFQNVETFQRFIDTINNMLDNEFVVIKEIEFPGVWKLGVGLIDLTQEHVHYQLYTIPRGKNWPLVCRLKGGFLTSKQPHKYAVSEHSSVRSSFAAPEAVGRQYILGHLKRKVERRELPVHGKLASTDVLLAFIGWYHRWLGLSPNEFTYTIADISRALHHHLFGLCAALVLQIPKGAGGDILLDLDLLGNNVDVQNIKPVFHPEIPLQFLVNTRRISFPAALQAFRYLVNSSTDAIVRPLARRSRSLASGEHWIWSGYSEEDEIRNVTTVLENSLEEYRAFVEGNRLKFPKSPYLDPNIAVIYEYISHRITESHKGPIINEHHVDNSQRQLPKLSVFTVTDGKSSVDTAWWPRPTLRIEGHEYLSMSSSQGVADFLFQTTPFLNMIYRMLRYDLEANYNLG